ncbi:protein of unknown function [Azospirillum lipoferum 4B]|uniref:Uncharacterized protein n=1 Tax=Azospirillum lipoferum (strain 4B) TaxID=862719 RepID=G7Z3Z9_AZOL4|nr:protein of unknown function [Azospirillum lipoferum 4B]
MGGLRGGPTCGYTAPPLNGVSVGGAPGRRSPPRPGCGCFSRKAIACPKPCDRRAW